MLEQCAFVAEILAGEHFKPRHTVFETPSTTTAKEFAYCIHTLKQGGLFLNAVVVKRQNKFRRSTNTARPT